MFHSAHPLPADSHRPKVFPFPAVPESIKQRYGVDRLFLRPFGFSHDALAVDYHQAIRPRLVTDILTACITDSAGQKPPDELFWDLTVGKRLECLLAITGLTGSEELNVCLHCCNRLCGQAFEIELSVSEMSTIQARADTDEQLELRIGANTVLIRRPNGGDQLDWLTREYQDENDAVKSMIGRLLTYRGEAPGGPTVVPDDAVPIIDAVMDQYDPLVDFNITVPCPSCGTESDFSVDLEGVVLGKLCEAQRVLFETIHHIAMHYHWDENQILELPPWRRSMYLSLIEKGEKV